MAEQSIQSGFLFIVVKGFPAESTKLGRRVFVEEGEIIEFRYFSPVHFRTQDNLYLKCEEEYFLENTKLYGKIWERVRFRNENTLKQILDCKLYDKENL